LAILCGGGELVSLIFIKKRLRSWIEESRGTAWWEQRGRCRRAVQLAPWLWVSCAADCHPGL